MAKSIVMETRRLMHLKFCGEITQAELERRTRELEEKEQLNLGIGAATEARAL